MTIRLGRRPHCPAPLPILAGHRRGNRQVWQGGQDSSRQEELIGPAAETMKTMAVTAPEVDTNAMRLSIHPPGRGDRIFRLHVRW